MSTLSTHLRGLVPARLWRVRGLPRLLKRSLRRLRAELRIAATSHPAGAPTARSPHTRPSRSRRGLSERLTVVIPSLGQLGPSGIPLLAGALALIDGYAPVRVVVTNGQMSGPGLAVCERPGVEIVEVESPDGFSFSRAVNVAVGSSDANRILLLNDDISGPARPDWLRWWLAQPAQLSSVALRWPHGRIAYGGIRWSGRGEMPSHRYTDRPASLLPRAPRTLAVSGAAMLLDRAVFDQVGGFCEELPLNYNDIDFCVQALASGVRARQFNRVVLTHWESATRGLTPPTEADLRTFERRCGPTLARYGVVVSADTVLQLGELRERSTPGSDLGGVPMIS